VDDEGLLRIIDARSGDVLLRCPPTGTGDGDDIEPHQLVYGPSGRYLVLLLRSGDLVVRDADTGRRLPGVAGVRTGAASFVATHPGGRILATSNGDGLVRLWRLGPGEDGEVGIEPDPLLSMQAPWNERLHPHFSPDGRWLAAVGERDVDFHDLRALTEELDDLLAEAKASTRLRLDGVDLVPLD